MLAIPSEIRHVVNLNPEYPVPVLKPCATDKQKIIYADFITELLTSEGCDRGYMDEPFFNINHK